MTQRAWFDPAVGQQVTDGLRVITVTHFVGLTHIAGQTTDGQSVALRREAVTLPTVAPPPVSRSVRDVHDLSPADVLEADRRFAIIEPLVAVARVTRSAVAARAREYELGTATAYRWIRRYRESGRRSALLETTPDGGRGCPRLAPEVEALVNATLEECYYMSGTAAASRAALPPEAVYRELVARCRKADPPLAPPARSTLLRRITWNLERRDRERRHVPRSKRNVPAARSFPRVLGPHQVVQVDHSQLNLVAVDSRRRLTVGRPWITVAIDVFSRAILGFYISLDPPSHYSVALCLYNAILGKGALLERYGLPATAWPMMGFFAKLHADNGKDFRGESLARACRDLGIDLEWRPVKRPRYGAFIERLAHTLQLAMRALPGDTGRSITSRGEYDAEGNAIFTLDEIEEWLVRFVTGIYHQRTHDGIGMAPLTAYERGIIGTEDMLGMGRPRLATDPRRLLLDLLPYELRKIHSDGVVIDNIWYHDAVLDKYVEYLDIRGVRPDFRFHRHPGNLGILYFYDPELNDYHEIPYRDKTHPAITRAELQAVRNYACVHGDEDLTERTIFDTYERLRELQARATTATKAMRRGDERQRRLRGQADALRRSVRRGSSLSTAQILSLPGIDDDDTNHVPDVCLFAAPDTLPDALPLDTAALPVAPYEDIDEAPPGLGSR